MTQNEMIGVDIDWPIGDEKKSVARAGGKVHMPWISPYGFGEKRNGEGWCHRVHLGKGGKAEGQKKGGPGKGGDRIRWGLLRGIMG